MNKWKISTIVLAVSLGVTVGWSAVRPASAEPQPNMVAAREHLKQARGSLDAANPDKGGHRVKAMALVDNAIAEVTAGIEFDNKH
jgi:hypothetical protein